MLYAGLLKTCASVREYLTDNSWNQGYETVAGVGKTGYNVVGGLGNAVMGGGQQTAKGSTGAENKDGE